MGVTVAVQPYRIWQSIVEEMQQNHRKEVPRRVLYKRFLMAGYGPEKANRWIDLYIKEFAIGEKQGIICLW